MGQSPDQATLPYVYKDTQFQKLILNFNGQRPYCVKGEEEKEQETYLQIKPVQ
jgi:hypothetical protein